MHVGDPVVQHYGDHLDLVGGEVHSWGAAHGPLWDALRKKGRQVRVIGIAVENATVDRTARVLEAWAAAEPGTPDEGLTVKREIKAIDDAMTHSDENCLARYGGFGGAMQRSAALQRLPEAGGKRRGRERPPPPQKKPGGHVTLDSGAEPHTAIRPHGGRSRPHLSLRRRLGTAPKSWFFPGGGRGAGLLVGRVNFPVA